MHLPALMHVYTNSIVCVKDYGFVARGSIAVTMPEGFSVLEQVEACSDAPRSVRRRICDGTLTWSRQEIELESISERCR